MPKIPITPPNRSGDELGPTQGGVEAIDCIFDKILEGYGLTTTMGYTISRRGGLWPWWYDGSQIGVDGLYWWSNRQFLIAVIMGRVYVFSNWISAPVEITSSTCRLNFGSKASIESSGKWLFITTPGSKPIMWNGDLSSPAQFITNSPQADMFTFLNDYILFNESSSNRIRMISAVADSLDTPVYQDGMFFSPQASADRLVALVAQNGELNLHGPKSLEYWRFDGTKAFPEVPFSRVSGAYLEYGCASPGTLLKFDNTLFWLDPLKRVVQLSGRSPTIISTPIDGWLRTITTLNDSFAFMVDRRFYCLTFPTDDYTFVYDMITGTWSKWSYWKTDHYERFLGANSVYCPEWNMNFVGSRNEGRIFQYDKNLVTDNMGPIRMLYRTAHMDWGTLGWKQANKLILRLKRGV